MQINGPATPQAAGLVIGPVPTLPNPGAVYTCGTEITAHIAVTGLVYCTAVFFYDPMSRARAMIHYNPVSGPKQPGFDECISSLRDTHGVQLAGLTVALFNNTHSSNGTPFTDTMYKIPNVVAFLTHALGAAHNSITATRYLFRGKIGLMDARGNVRGAPGPDLPGLVKNWVHAYPNTNRPQRFAIGSYRT